jgi:hypothetical protein
MLLDRLHPFSLGTVMYSNTMGLLLLLVREVNHPIHLDIAENADEQPPDHLLVRGAGRSRFSAMTTEQIQTQIPMHR